FNIEILELMQGLQWEWPEVYSRDYVQKYSWLVNRSEKPNAFTAVNQAQEQNISDIKVTYHSFGPGATWEYLHKVSPAIPTLRAVQWHMEREFVTLTWGAQHGAPSKDEDVGKLTDQYVKSKLHIYTQGWNNKGVLSSHAEDVINTGVVDLEHLHTLENWWKVQAYQCWTDEEW
ncbi:hypothetical protein SCLCIDRAFT_82628, partial [Scleroderma citrinum Foug A]